MGFFSSERDERTTASSEIGTFHSVHPVKVVMDDIVCPAVRDQLSSGEVVPREPGVLASIYVSELTANRLVIKAGNVLDTYFSFAVELADDEGGTRGRVTCDPSENEIKKWRGNVIQLKSGLEITLGDASATVEGF